MDWTVRRGTGSTRGLSGGGLSFFSRLFSCIIKRGENSRRSPADAISGVCFGTFFSPTWRSGHVLGFICAVVGTCSGF